MQFIASTEDRLAMLDARLEMMNKTLLGRIRWTSAADASRTRWGRRTWPA